MGAAASISAASEGKPDRSVLLVRVRVLVDRRDIAGERLPGGRGSR
jgi:hypothetical protein